MRSQSRRFPYVCRLTNTHDFDRVFKEGARFSDAFLIATAYRNDMSVPRLGFALSRRVTPAAHERNRIKRIVRESFRENAQRLVGRDFIVQAKKQAAGASNRTLHESIERLWRRVTKKVRSSLPECGATDHRTRLPHG